jgi:hypothetical protein
LDPREREEVAEGWRRLHNEDLCNLYASPYIIRVTRTRRMRWARHVTCRAEMRNTHSILVGKSEEERPLKRPRCRWEDNVTIDVKEIGWEGVGSIHLAQDRFHKRWQIS